MHGQRVRARRPTPGRAGSVQGRRPTPPRRLRRRRGQRPRWDDLGDVRVSRRNDGDPHCGDVGEDHRGSLGISVSRSPARCQQDVMVTRQPEQLGPMHLRQQPDALAQPRVPDGFLDPNPLANGSGVGTIADDRQRDVGPLAPHAIHRSDGIRYPLLLSERGSDQDTERVARRTRRLERDFVDRDAQVMDPELLAWAVEFDQPFRHPRTENKDRGRPVEELAISVSPTAVHGGEDTSHPGRRSLRSAVGHAGRRRGRPSMHDFRSERGPGRHPDRGSHRCRCPRAPTRGDCGPCP